jgi:hypothetical protein
MTGSRVLCMEDLLLKQFHYGKGKKLVKHDTYNIIDLTKSLKLQVFIYTDKIILYKIVQNIEGLVIFLEDSPTSSSCVKVSENT